MNSMQIVLAVYAFIWYETEHPNADTAILNSALQKRVYKEVPVGITTSHNMVCMLDKAIYGVKQAANEW